MNQTTYWLDSGLHKIYELIDTLYLPEKWPFIVLVAWGTASGKTSRVAEKIKDHFEGSQIISMDNYYRGHAFMQQQKKLWNNLNWDQPEALNLELFYQHVSELKKGNTIYTPEYDFKTEPVFDAIEIQPSKIIIIEGLFALDDSIATLGNLNIFVDIWAHGQIMRRIFRDIQRTGEKPQDIMEYFLETVEPMHMKYVLPTKKNANIVISNEYNPEIESQNSWVNEIDFKIELQDFDLQNFEDAIYKLWGTYLWEVEHNDRYFHTNISEIDDVDEVIKIRKIDTNKMILSYKWPINTQDSYEDRAIMRFFIDEEVYQLFKTVYSKRIKELHKFRKNYFLWWVLVSFDVFTNGRKFIDCKYEKGQSIGILYELFDILQIDYSHKLTDHYLKIV